MVFPPPSWLLSAMSSLQPHSSLANSYMSSVTNPSKTGEKNSQILLNFTYLSSTPLQLAFIFFLEKFPTGSAKSWSRFSGWWLSTASWIPWSTLVKVFPRKWAQAYLRHIWELLTNMIHFFRDPYLTIWWRLQYLPSNPLKSFLTAPRLQLAWVGEVEEILEKRELCWLPGNWACSPLNTFV